MEASLTHSKAKVKGQVQVLLTITSACDLSIISTQGEQDACAEGRWAQLVLAR